jgi:hypothetical protein
LTVFPGPVVEFALSGIPSTGTVGVGIPVTVTAKDAYGNTVTSYNGPAPNFDDSLMGTFSETGNFNAGVFTMTWIPNTAEVGQQTIQAVYDYVIRGDGQIMGSGKIVSNIVNITVNPASGGSSGGSGGGSGQPSEYVYTLVLMAWDAEGDPVTGVAGETSANTFVYTTPPENLTSVQQLQQINETEAALQQQLEDMGWDMGSGSLVSEVSFTATPAS